VEHTESTLVYDGDCGICQKSVELLARIGARVEPVPSHLWLVDHPEDAERTTTIVLLVGPDGRVAEAEHAVAGTLRLARRPAPWLGALIEVPGIHLLARHAYRLVAANRARISRSLGLKACALDRAST
jgi:predicted DCC family thiol-disulfide oxidoreductase YuxK